MEYYEKIARILRCDKDTIRSVESHLGGLTGNHGVMDAVGKENEARMKECLKTLGVPYVTTARKIYNALIMRIEADEKKLFDAMGSPKCGTTEGCVIINKFLFEAVPQRKGFFLKKERFIELLEKEPPPKIMQALSYQTVSEMFEKEDWREIAAALRFLEGNSWINTTLLPYYRELTPADFEERDIDMVAINEKWIEKATPFVAKKYHNISHLKELGIIFILPTNLHFDGELIRTVALLAHYLNEVPFYSNLFSKAAENPERFSEQLVSLLRGDVLDERSVLIPGDWMIIQRYLGKDDENDWRLFEPHVNPEAIHWERAENIVGKVGEQCGVPELSFWENLNWVGDYFPTNTGIEVLVSFNLVDTAMSLVQKKEMIKYLYHHQEALWNKIFSSYFSENLMEGWMKEHLVRGYIRPDTDAQNIKR